MAESERAAAERLLKSGSAKKAVDRFRALLAQRPEDPELRGRLAVAYQLAGNADRAFHHFSQSARTLVALGDDARAAHLLEQADAVAPNEPEVLFRLAGCLERMGREDALLACCERLDRAASRAGDRRQLWALERLARAHPHDAELALRQARLLTESGQGPAAAAAWSRLLALPPYDRPPNLFDELERAAEELPELSLAVAEHLLEDGEPAAALRRLAPLRSASPSAATLTLAARCLHALQDAAGLREVRFELAQKLTSEGHAREALKVVSSILELNRSDTGALELGGQLAAHLGDTERGARMWARYVHVQHEAGHTRERDRGILNLLRFAPEDPRALRVAANALAASGRHAEAEALGRRISNLESKGTTPTGPVSSPTSSVYGRGLSFGPATGSSPKDTVNDALGPSTSTRQIRSVVEELAVSDDTDDLGSN